MLRLLGMEELVILDKKNRLSLLFMWAAHSSTYLSQVKVLWLDTTWLQPRYEGLQVLFLVLFADEEKGGTEVRGRAI